MSAITAPSEVWEPLPTGDWNEAAARHLLRRIGWTATPDAVAAAARDGLAPTLDRAFPRSPALLAEAKDISDLRDPANDLRKAAEGAGPEERRRLQKEQRERFRQALQNLSLQWLQFAADPRHSAAEKWVLFLGDVYVVGAEKVRNPALVFDHFRLMRARGLSTAPLLTKSVSRSPAMIQYLDLQQNKREAPNENFARELFELFVLGEGNYTERDIKEAARAFTGYRYGGGSFQLARKQMDPGSKTVFGQTGRFSGDDVIDLAYRQPAAAEYLPHEMVRFYLTDDPLPRPELAALGAWWRQTGFDLRKLALRFFGSRLFFDPRYRENYIKSPVQFYLGLVQDLQLAVLPLPRVTLATLRLMGQTVFDPPNVRGWVGGRSWINSTTLQARRQLVQSLFTRLNEDRLNADDRVRLDAARALGHGNFVADAAALDPRIATADPESAARRLMEVFLPVSDSPSYRRYVADALENPGPGRPQLQHRFRVLETLLQSPEYQLC